MSKHGGGFHYSNRSNRRHNETNPQLIESSTVLCGKCGRDFINNPCDACRSQELMDFRSIREFLSNRPNANAMEIANATGVDISSVSKLIKSGALRIVREEGLKNTVRRGSNTSMHGGYFPFSEDE